jgi:hypothetical protein
MHSVGCRQHEFVFCPVVEKDEARIGLHDPGGDIGNIDQPVREQPRRIGRVVDIIDAEKLDEQVVLDIQQLLLFKMKLQIGVLQTPVRGISFLYSK